jgi:flavin-dependent dehydrogenase
VSPLTDPQPLPVVVVVATATVMDGQVVRWYRSQAHAAARECSVSASARRVSVHDDEYQTLPQEWVLLATDVHRQLARDPNANVGHVVTHRRVGLTDTLEPV